MFRTFTRTWWKYNPKWPGGLEPCAGRRTYGGKFLTEEGARAECRRYNETHEPGRFSRKMEYEKI